MGLKSTQCWPELERTLWSLNFGEASCACEQHVGGLASRKTAEPKKIVPPESLENVDQRRWWLHKIWAPSKIIIFHGDQIETVLTGGRKNVMESKLWWGIVRMRTTCRRPLQVGKQQNQSRWCVQKACNMGTKEHGDSIIKFWPHRKL